LNKLSALKTRSPERKITGYIIVELIVGFLTAGVGNAVKWSTKLGPTLTKKRVGYTGVDAFVVPL